MAEQWAGDPPPSERPKPRVSEWSPEREALADIIDRLGGVLQAVVAAAGVKPKRVPPALRPETASMRLRRARRVEAHRRLVARVLPHRHTRPDETG